MRPRLRKFIGYYGKYRARFAKVMLCALISSAASLMLPLCTRRIANLAQGGGDVWQAITRVGFLMLALLAVEAAFDFYFDCYGHALGARMESDLRAELFAHLQKLSFRFYDDHRVGSLMSSLTNDMLDLTELFHHGPEDYLMNLVRLLGASAILIGVNWRLALAVLAFVPALAAAILWWGRRLRRVSAENQSRIAEINAGASDELGGIRTVQAYAREGESGERFRGASERFFGSRCRVYRTESYADKTTLVLVRLISVAVVFFGGVAVTRGEMDLADMIAFLMYVGYVTDPIRHLSWMVTQYQTGMAGFDRVMDLMETEPEIRDRPDAVEARGIRGEIDMRGVTFAYGDGEPVLDGLTLKIPAGQFVALVGMSGQGKSTLGALLPRFYEPQAGEIRLDGRDAREYTLASLRGAIALVRQDEYLFDDTVAGNIRMGKPDASDAEVARAAELADADGFVRQLPEGYRSVVGERGVKLSGGQRQRLGIARALLKDAPVLLLDEATSSLDNAAERRVYDAIRACRKGRTTVVIAHRLSTVRDADRIVVLENGAIVEDGPHDALMRLGGTYAALYRHAAAI